MTERLSPGVYVEDVSSGIRPIQSVATSTAGFVGEAPMGVTGVPTFVRGMADFTRHFGGHRAGPDGYLAQAVEGYFAAGGSRAFVVRVLPGDAVTAVGEDVLARADDHWGNDRRVLRFAARGAGSWAHNLRVHLRRATAFPDTAFLVEIEWVEQGRGRIVERYDNVVMDPSSPDYVVEVVNDASRYVHVTDLHETEFLDADLRTDLPLPDVAAGVPTHEGDAFRVPLDARLTVRWSGPEGLGEEVELVFSGEATVAAGGTVEGDEVELDAAQLQTLLSSQLPGDDADAPRFVVEEGPPAVVRAPIATNAYLVALLPDDADDSVVDLGGTDELTITLTDAAGDDEVVATVDTTALDDTALDALVDEVQAALVDADLDDVVEVEATTRALLLSTRAPRAEGTILALAVDAGTPFQADPETRDGAAGAVVDDQGTVAVVVSERIEPGRRPALPTVFPRSRGTGFAESSPANPDLRPVLTGDSPLRLRGGTDGTGPVSPTDYRGAVTAAGRTGLRAFDDVDFQLLVMPGRNEPAFLAEGIAYADRNRIFYVADGAGSDDRRFAVDTGDVVRYVDGLPMRSDNVAMFYPWIEVSDPVGVGRAPTRFVPPSGHVAGMFARTDRQRGVWKAPAGLEAAIPGAIDLQHRLLDADQDLLNPMGLNCIRQRPGAGIVSWGARTLSSDPEWRYTPVRRTALFLMESLRRGLQWVVFEPNDVELWGRIRSNVEAFMLGLHRQGAFQGETPAEAFAVKCDRETNPQELLDQGMVTVLVGFAPVKPAEFVVVQVSQKTLVAA